MMGYDDIALLASLFFIIATLYSSAGFGGGSSYLALLALFVTDFMAIKTAALLCNLVVVSSGSFLFVKNGLFDRKRFIPLAVCSVPAAFLGAMVQLPQKSFFICLGAVLALSGLLLIVQLLAPQPGTERHWPASSWLVNIGLGGGTGFLSGLVGIGGGILLSPILNLLRWDSARKVAALASFFILVNSISGLLGQAAGGDFKLDLSLQLPLLFAVFIGGQVGTRFNLNLKRPQLIRGITGVLVCYIGLKLILKHASGIDI